MGSIAIASGGSALQPAFGNIDLFVSNLGSDSNDGSAAHPFATIQHAVTVGFSTVYASLYTLTINVAAGTYNENVNIVDDILFGKRLGPVSADGFLTGDTGTPTNVKIAPTTGANFAPLTINGGFWRVDGFSLVVDSTIPTGSDIFACSHALVELGNMDFDLGSSTDSTIITAQEYSKLEIGTGSENITIHGVGATISNATAFDCNVYSQQIFNAFISFNSAINMLGNAVWRGANLSSVDISGLIGAVTGSTNVTGGYPVLLTNQSGLVLTADPTTNPLGTWPGGAWTPAHIDDSSNVDGFSYAIQKSGLPANTDLYQGTWGFIKDTSGGGVYAAYNDAGTIKKVALT